MPTLVETPVFTRRVADLWTEEELREFQSHLIEHPESGDLIRRSGGLRKIRWGREGRANVVGCG